MLLTPFHQLIVAVALIEQDKKILVVRRHDPEHAQWHQRWGFPGGKIELYETPNEALRREIKQKTSLIINSEKLLGVYTQYWNTSGGIQQTFILLYHCTDFAGEVHLNEEEIDAFVWERPESILRRSDFLDGNVKMFEQLFFNNISIANDNSHKMRASTQSYASSSSRS